MHQQGLSFCAAPDDWSVWLAFHVKRRCCGYGVISLSATMEELGSRFTEVMVRNPETNEERVIVIPTLQAASAKTEG